MASDTDALQWNYFGGFSAWRGFTGTSSSDVISYSGFGTSISQWSNQPAICCKRSTRCHGWNLAEFQRPKHLLAACAGRRAIVSFPEDEHHRRFHIIDVTDR